MLTAAASKVGFLLRAFDHVTGKLSRAPKPSPGAADPFVGILPWELTTKEAVEVPRLQRSREGTGSSSSRQQQQQYQQLPSDAISVIDDAYGAALLEFSGVCTIRGAVSPEAASRCHEAAEGLVEDVRGLVRDRGVDPDGPGGFQFRGAHQRDPGRLDIRNHAAMLEPPFDAPELSGAAAWMPLIHRVLGPDARLVWKGLVVTEPGAGDQAFHPDGPPVSREEWLLHDDEQQQQQQQCGPDGVPSPPLTIPVTPGAPLPAHSLTVFVPLVDLSASNGPTAFLPGTHLRHLAASAMAAEAENSGSTAGAGQPALLAVDKGDAIVFDVRCQHAGSANRSASRRPLLYFVYGRSWYDEAEHRRLCEELGFVERGARAEPLFPVIGEQ